MKRVASLVAALTASLAASAPAIACSPMEWDPNTVVENPRFDSDDASFTLVVRTHPRLGDFETTTEGALAGLTPPFIVDEEEESPDSFVSLEGFDPYVPADPLESMGPAPWDSPAEDADDEPAPLTAALYRNLASGARALVARFELDEPWLPGRLFVSNDGRFVVAVTEPQSILSICGGPQTREGIVIYGIAPATTRRLELSELATASDLRWFHFGYARSIGWAVRVMPNTGVPALVVTFPPVRRAELPTEIDIDLATGIRLQPLADVYPPLTRVSVAPAPAGYAPSGTGCTPDTAIRSLDSAELLERATHTPPPGYPEVAFRAGVRGSVVVEVVVADDGMVTCARVVKGLPFGLSESAMEALRKWHFSTRAGDERNAGFSGVVAVEFQIGKPE